MLKYFKIKVSVARFSASDKPSLSQPSQPTQFCITIVFYTLVHYEVTMSGALMANYYISWRLENNVMSSKYLVMRALHDH